MSGICLESCHVIAPTEPAGKVLIGTWASSMIVAAHVYAKDYGGYLATFFGSLSDSSIKEAHIEHWVPGNLQGVSILL